MIGGIRSLAIIHPGRYATHGGHTVVARCEHTKAGLQTGSTMPADAAPQVPREGGP
jgi:hypothetical protein